jgi:hypothetical protein
MTYVTHELGHIYENKTIPYEMGTYVGGDHGDELNKFLWENSKYSKAIILNPLEKIRFYNPNKPKYINPNIPRDFAGNQEFSYGNGCVADYFAQVFAFNIFNPSESPEFAKSWLESIINLEVSRLP